MIDRLEDLEQQIAQTRIRIEEAKARMIALQEDVSAPEEVAYNVSQKDPIAPQDRKAYDTFLNEIKKNNTVDVCGKRRMKTYFYPQKDDDIVQEINFVGEFLSKAYAIVVISILSSGYENAVKQKKLERKMNKYFNTGENIAIVLLFSDDNHPIQTKILPFKEAISDLIRKWNELQENYNFESSGCSGIFVKKFSGRPGLSNKQIVKGGQKIIRNLKKYTIISPESQTNCFYHCMAYYNLLEKGELEKMDENRIIVQMARDYKRQFGNEKDHATTQDIKKVADSYGATFTIYDNLFRKVKTEDMPAGEIIGKTEKMERKSSKMIGQKIKLQFLDGHCCLMVPKEKYADFADKYEQMVERKQTDSCHAIIPRKPFHKKENRFIWTLDIEAYKKSKQCGTQKAFALGVCTNFDTTTFENSYKDFYGTECVNEFFDFLDDYKIEGHNNRVYIYSHNGAKYDLAVINETLLRRQDFKIIREEFTELNGAVISQTIVNQHEVQFIFRDSARLFAGSLAGLCKDLKPKFTKLVDHKFAFDDLNEQSIHQEILKTEIREYMMHDCLSLAEIMIKFRHSLIDDAQIQIDICDCYTAATLAKKLFFSKYYWKKCQTFGIDGKIISKDYIYELTKELDLEIRKSYQGGRCDIYKYGAFKGKFYYYDFTSLYPYVGHKQQYPIGLPKKVAGEDIEIKKFFGYITCKVWTNKDVLPLHGYKHNGKLVFGHHEGSEMVLFSEEIKRGEQIGNRYEFISGLQFKKSKLLEGIMGDGFKNKAKAKKDGKPVMEKTWKIIINSAYGFFGLRWMDKRGVKFMSGEQLDAAILEKRVYSYNKIADNEYMVDQENDLFDIKGKSIPIASAVTSYARLELYNFMVDIQAKGSTIYYTDTDSVITDCNIKMFPDLLTKYQWDGCGDELGCIKNECDDKCRKELGSGYAQQLENDGGELYFDEIQILGPKEYSLKKTLINGKVIEIAKAKGVKNSSFQEQKEMLDGQIKEKIVTQFISGKNAYMKEQKIEGRVYVKDVKKYLCQYKINKYKDDKDQLVREATKVLKYSKGYIKGQDVFPLQFVGGEQSEQ